MITRILATLTVALPGTAWAHPGHVSETGGHDHWLALAILGGIGIVLVGWGLVRLARTLRQRSRA